VLDDVTVDPPDDSFLPIGSLSEVDDDTTEFSVETMLWWFDVSKLSTALPRLIMPVSDCSNKGALKGALGAGESDMMMYLNLSILRRESSGEWKIESDHLVD